MERLRRLADERERPLELVSLRPGRLCLEFEHAARRCGYATRRHPLSPGGAPERRRAGEPIVLLVDEDDGEEQMRACLEAPRLAGPWFGVFGAPATGPRGGIASRCADFLIWPASRDELSLRLGRFVAWTGNGQRAASPIATMREFANFNLVGESRTFTRLLDQVRRVAVSDATVLVEGATGTGKELVARAVHYLGHRGSQPFVPVNCGALPDNLIENELFGHERGAFTDARERVAGVIEQAHGGTLFLDEIEALPPKGQVSLLRFLQDWEFRPLGARGARRADVRVIAASNAPLQQLADDGAFRADLLYRLNILHLLLPPLRDRPEDIEPLARRFLGSLRARYGGTRKVLHPLTLAWMKRYPWPGNVRELENVLHRAYVMSDSPVIYVEATDVSLALEGEATGRDRHPFHEAEFSDAKARVIHEFERDYLRWLMTECKGNVTLAARRAGKERRALGKLLKKHGIDRRAF